MKIETTTWEEAAQLVGQGQVGVVPTDTLYGLVGSALRPAVVERVYALRRRELGKPFIVLLSGAADLTRFQIEIDDRTQELFNKVWPGPVSIIVPAASSGLAYLHRGTQGIAFRVPGDERLRAWLAQTGPVVAPSANLAGEEPAHTVAEAWAYFGDEVFYVDGGEVHGAPSALVDARGGEVRVLRPAPGFVVPE